jgi:CBS domain-containing protein
MRASDVMASKVITIGVNALVEDVARVLLKHRISAVPVVGERGELVGIVSEGDLIRRPETGTAQRPTWWRGLFVSKSGFAARYVKTHSRNVADVMTRNVITAAPESPLDEIVSLFERHRIKRVPVVQNDKIVGLVSRADLIEVLAERPKKRVASPKIVDSEIRRKLIARLTAEPWCPSMLNVKVHNGAVEMWGYVSSNEERKAAKVAVEGMPGVKLITDNLMIPPATLGAI